MSQKGVKMFCDKTHFLSLPFFGKYKKPYGVHGFRNSYHMQLYPKMVHGKCAIRQIPYECVACTNMLDKPWDPVISP